MSEHVLLDEFEKAFSLSLDRELVVSTMRSAYLEHLVDLREITAFAAIARAVWRLLPMAVASGDPKLVVDRSLRVTGLRPLFDTIFTFDDVGVAKPQQDIFLRAASDIDIAPPHCLVRVFLKVWAPKRLKMCFKALNGLNKTGRYCPETCK